MDAILTAQEKRTLNACEQDIERNLKGLVLVADALMTIKKDRLYRDKYGTFEGYCEARWNFSGRHANRLIAAKPIAEEVENGTNGSRLSTTKEQSPGGETSEDSQPISERAARELGKLSGPEQRTAAWERALKLADDAAPKHAHVKAAVAEIILESNPQVEGYQETIQDAEGQPIPDRLALVFSQGIDALKEARNLLLKADKLLGEQAAGIQGAYLSEIVAESTDGKSFVANIRTLRSTISALAPHAVCPSCNGHGKDCAYTDATTGTKHRPCRETGYMTKELWGRYQRNEQ